jgi:hypothetical protein
MMIDVSGYGRDPERKGAALDEEELVFAVIDEDTDARVVAFFGWLVRFHEVLSYARICFATLP